MKKKNQKIDSDKPKVHDELKGFNININKFGELESSIQVDKLNEFLNENVEDKRLQNTGEEE